MTTETQFYNLILRLDNMLRSELLELFYLHGEDVHSAGIRGANEYDRLVQEKAGTPRASTIRSIPSLTIYAATTEQLLRIG